MLRSTVYVKKKSAYCKGVQLIVKECSICKQKAELVVKELSLLYRSTVYVKKFSLL